MWVTATGAFLLLAAAVVFVAVRWDHLGDEAKLGVLGAATGGFLLAGRRLRDQLPATGGVLFHLGALLIPLDVAALGVHAHLGWGQLLLAVGGTAAAAWATLARIERSPVLRWATGGAVVVTAAGVDAVGGPPTAVVLAAAAAVALRLRAHRAALGWALVAGLGPLLVFVRTWVERWPTAADLGLVPHAPGAVWAVSGTLAAFVVAAEAHRRRDALLVVPAGLSVAIGLAATWSSLDPSPAAGVLGVAVLVLLAELAAGATRQDPFWARPASLVAGGGEVLLGFSLPCALVTTPWWFATTDSHRLAPAALTVAALAATAAWVAADVRRVEGDPRRRGLGWTLAFGSGWWPATVGIAGSSVAAVALATGSPMATGIAMTVLAAVVVVTGRPAGPVTAAALAATAPLLAGLPAPAVLELTGPTASMRVQELLVAVLGGAGGLLVAWAAVVRAPHADREGPEQVVVLAAGALLPIATATAVLADRVDPLVLALAVVAAAEVVAAVLDRGDPHVAGRERGVPHLGAVGRVGAPVALIAAPALGARDTAIVAGVLATAAIVDAARLRRAEPLLGLSVSLPVVVGATAAALGWNVPEIGVALVMLAVVASGAHLLLGDRQGWPLLGVVFASATAGFGLAATEPTAGWLAVLGLSGIGLAYATVRASTVGAAASGAGAVVAVWGLLVDGGVEASDAYVAPVAVVLLVAGAIARRSGRLGSWVAYGPAIALLGGSALTERVAGGGGGHALLAGGMAVAAVLVGGARRLAAPLLIGTALLVGVVGYESIAVTRQVPTWAWLALGGSVLVAAGIAMERRDTTPFQAGRRLVDVVSSRFG